MRATFARPRKNAVPAKAQPVPPADPPKTGPRVLFIDDDGTIRELAQTLLTQAGFEMELLDHGPADFSFYESLNIDAAVVDLSLPGLSGNEVIANLRSVPRNAQLPIIICTSSSDIEAIHTCYTQHNAAAVLQKPVDWPAMIAALKRATAQNVAEHSQMAAV